LPLAPLAPLPLVPLPLAPLPLAPLVPLPLAPAVPLPPAATPPEPEAFVPAAPPAVLLVPPPGAPASPPALEVPGAGFPALHASRTLRANIEGPSRQGFELDFKPAMAQSLEQQAESFHDSLLRRRLRRSRSSKL
jgi:hypothetical protein